MGGTCSPHNTGLVLAGLSKPNRSVSQASTAQYPPRCLVFLTALSHRCHGEGTQRVKAGPPLVGYSCASHSCGYLALLLSLSKAIPQQRIHKHRLKCDPCATLHTMSRSLLTHTATRCPGSHLPCFCSYPCPRWSCRSHDTKRF